MIFDVHIGIDYSGRETPISRTDGLQVYAASGDEEPRAVRRRVVRSQNDKVLILQQEEKLAGDPALEASVKVNVEENARLTFDHLANDKIKEMIDSNFKFYKQVTDDPAFEKFFFDWLFERYKKEKKASVDDGYFSCHIPDAL